MASDLVGPRKCESGSARQLPPEQAAPAAMVAQTAAMADGCRRDRAVPACEGMTSGEISAHFSDIVERRASKETVSRITDRVVAEMNDRASMPLDPVYAAVFIDAIHVKVRDGQVANRPVYAAIGVTADGCTDVLGCDGRRWRGREVLDERARRPEEPWRARRSLLRRRRRQGPAGGRRERMATSHRPNMHCAHDQKRFPAVRPTVRGDGSTLAQRRSCRFSTTTSRSGG